MLLVFAAIAHLHPLQCVMHQGDPVADQQQVPSHGIVSGNDGLLSLTKPGLGTTMAVTWVCHSRSRP